MAELDPVAALDAAKEEIQKRIAAEKILQKQLNKDLRRVEKLTIEDCPDKKQRIADKLAELTESSERLIELDVDLKGLNRSVADETEEKIDAALFRVEQEWIAKQPTTAYIISDQYFTFINDFSTTPDKQNVQIRNLEPLRFIEFLANELKIKSWHLPVPRVKDLFNTADRTFDLSRFSIDSELWNSRKVYLPIKHMEQYFIDKVPCTIDPDSLQYFDCLMHSLSGGKQENQEHIEKWILHKIINYRKAVTTPDIVIVGHVGGNGKGILQAIIRQMLPAILSGKANAKTLNGDFNAIMLGKLIVFFDDQNSKEIPLEVVKQLAGSETMIFEPKGKDQYEGEKTHSSAWFSNNLPFKLTPGGQEGGVDRRFSIMRTNITFLESLRKHYKETLDTELSVEESKDFAEEIVSKILLNRTCIAQWFKHLQSKHPEVNKDYALKPLHGEDYHYFLDRQVSSLEVIWRDLISHAVINGGCVPVFVIKELLRHMDGREPSDKTLSAKVMEIASQNKIEIELERTYVTMTDGKVHMKKQCAVLHSKNKTAWTDRSFDWRKVSTQSYLGAHENTDVWIPDEHLIFGVHSDKVTDIDIIAEDTNLLDFSCLE